MKRTATLLVLLLGLSFNSQAFAHGNEEHESNTHAGHHAKEGKEVTLNGELIGLTCFLKHGSKGEPHKSCAKECAEKGLPIGLLVNGQIYQISGDGHQSLIEAYKPLLKYMESKVMVKGDAFEKNGVKILVIEKIKKV